MKSLEFKGKWRGYQKRVLDELDAHLDDRHLHVVAAPGSGKTILGIEVMRRLSQPAVILAPTLTIRNQWRRRIAKMFLEEKTDADNIISHDIRQPNLITVITYQALHAAFSGEAAREEEDAEEESEDGADIPLPGEIKEAEEIRVLDALRRGGVTTLVLDEAHHLRREWWKALTDLKHGLPDVRVISLTATPPYDVDGVEWRRYEELCGPIDAEISVPELVKSGDLCPHQDFVWFGHARREEQAVLQQYRADALEFLRGIEGWRAFCDAVAAHPWVARPMENIEAILDEPAFYTALLSYLTAAGGNVPRAALHILGISRREVPPLTAARLEALLNGVIFHDRANFAAVEKEVEELERHLKRIGALERRQVMLTRSRSVQKILGSSAGRLDAIVEIVKVEHAALQNRLRMVVLGDFIRAADLPANPDDLRPLTRVGVAPIFETLRRAKIDGLRPAILTGSLIVIPVAAWTVLQQIASSQKLKTEQLQATPAGFDKNFLTVNISGTGRQQAVSLMTALFSTGEVNVMIGTQALLGEGWDAPSINSLVLASNVGSYMLSNQMRGRAIRKDPRDPDKVSNIWHIATVDPCPLREEIDAFLGRDGKDAPRRKRNFDPFDELKKDLGPDVDALRRRFRAFEGPSFTEPVMIENGFRRLGLYGIDWDEEDIDNTNANMAARATDRAATARHWTTALQANKPGLELKHMVRGNYAPVTLAMRDTLRWLLVQGILTGGLTAGQAMKGIRADTLKMLLAGLIILIVAALPATLKALWLWLRNGSLEGSTRQVGRAVVDALHDQGIITTAKDQLRVDAAQDRLGVVHCRLEGATTIEKSHFLQAMEQVLGPVENPRYVLVRRSRLWRFLRTDYHPVPDVIGRKKEQAEFFARRWRRYVGGSQLVYTRTPEGRQLLLRARSQSLVAAFRKKSERLNRWE